MIPAPKQTTLRQAVRKTTSHYRDGNVKIQGEPDPSCTDAFDTSANAATALAVLVTTENFPEARRRRKTTRKTGGAALLFSLPWVSPCSLLFFP